MSIQERLRQSETATRDERERLKAIEQFTDPRRGTREATGDTRRHSDAESMRRHFGIGAYSRDAFDYPGVIPNCLEKDWNGPASEVDGGTDFLATGKPGSGKSTLGCYVSLRDIEINRSKVVWRGSSSRSEWLALAPWARLCLPADVDPTIRLESKDPREPSVALDVDELDKIVRDVVRYEDPLDLNKNLLQEGVFHVVYPDPYLRGCQEILEASEEKTYDSPSDRGLFDEEDPATHWWFAWVLARVEHGPHHWTTWICDEIGDLAPQSAQKDQFGTYQKVELLKDCWVDARKFGLSIGCFGHSEVDIHQMVRRKLRWRIQMPGTSNPTSAGDVVGFGSVPMETDMTSRMPVGNGLFWTETNFEPFAWSDVSPDHSYKLKIKVGT